MEVPFWRQSSRLPLKYIRHLGGQRKHIERTSGCTRMPRDVAGLAPTADGTQPKTLLAPYPAEEMTCWPVSPRVGNVKNNHPSLIEPIAGAGWARRIGWPMETMSWHRKSRSRAPRIAPHPVESTDLARLANLTSEMSSQFNLGATNAWNR
jgi:hypothetical protein